MNIEQQNLQQLPKTIGLFFWHFIKKQRLAFLFFLLAPTVMILENNVIPYSLKMIVDA
jgi:ATP-binding cassette subfamily B protein